MKKPRKTKTGNDTSIVNGHLYFEDCHQCPVDSPDMEAIIGDGYTNSIRVISLDTEWVSTVYLDHSLKVTEFIDIEMTLRREIRSHRGHWYAYRRVLGKLHKRYVGTDDKVTQARLLQIGRELPSIPRKVR